MDVKGVKVAIVAYRTDAEQRTEPHQRVILSDEAKELINSFNYEVLDEDLKKVRLPLMPLVITVQLS